MAKHAFTTSQLSANCVKIREVVAEKEGLVTILSKEVERGLSQHLIILTLPALHRRVEAQKAKQIYREKVFAELGKLEPGVSEVVLARSKTIDITEAERAVADLEARLEMSMQADPSVVERYKRLKKEVRVRKYSADMSARGSERLCGGAGCPIPSSQCRHYQVFGQIQPCAE